MYPRWYLLIILTWVVVWAPQHAEGSSLQARVSPPVQPGFPLLLDASHVYLSGLTAADLNGDGKKELIFGARELDAHNTALGGYGCRGVVYAVKSDGGFLWRTVVRADVDSTPLVVDDLSGDGQPDIVVGMGAFEAPQAGEGAATECGKGNPDLPGNGGVVALNGVTGALLWTFNTADKGEWGVPDNGVLDGVWGAPASGDLLPDSPGPEIVFGSWDNCIYLLRADGSSAWGITPFDYSLHPALANQCNNRGFLSHDTVWSSPALADLDGDKRLDIIIGGDSTAPNWYTMPNGGVLWVIGADGGIMAQKTFDQTLYSSPAIADLDGDGQWEIIVGTGDFWYDGGALSGTHHSGRYITVLNYDRNQADPKQRLRTKWTLATNGPMRSSPAIGDLNLDGRPDIVAISKYDPVGGRWTIGNRETDGSYLYAWNGVDGALLPGFPIHICDSTGQAFPLNTSPLIADVVGDQHPEIIYPHGREIGIMAWENPTGLYSSYTRINDNQACWPAKTIGGGQTSLVYSRLNAQSGAFTATPLINDLDGDGDAEIAAVGRWNEDGGSLQGDLWVWTGLKDGARPWPMTRQNSRHTGVFSLIPQVSAPTVGVSLYQVAGGTTATSGKFQLRNAGATPLRWEVTAKPASVTLTPMAGTLQEFASVDVSVSLSASKYVPGVYQIGNAVITSQALSAPSPVPLQTEIALTLVVRGTETIFLPLVSKAGASVTAQGSVIWERSAFSLGGGQVIDASSTYADLNGDGQAEILVGTTTQECHPASGGCTFDAPGTLSAFHADGSLFWERRLPGSIASAPAVGDIDGDGWPEVVVTVGYDEDVSRAGRVMAFQRDGTLLWEYLPLDRDGNGVPDPIVASPTLCRLRGDGRLNIVFGGLDGHIRALDSLGQVVWDYDNAYAIRSSAACADLNRDGNHEVIVGATCTPDNPHFCGAGVGGRLFIFDQRGQPLVRLGLPEAIWSSPIVGDVNRDGRSEIVVGTSWLWWKLRGITPPYLYAFDTGRVFDSGLSMDDPAKLPTLPGWPQQLMYPVSGSPILADLNRDGALEVVAAASHPDLANDAIPGTGLVYAFSAAGQLLPGWPVRPVLWQNQQTALDGPIRGSPIAADLDGDGQVEVLVSALKSVYIYRTDGTIFDFPASTTANVWATPAVGDMDQDGRVEIWLGGTSDADPTRGFLWRFTARGRGFGALSWPMFRQNPQNTGQYR